MSGNNAADNRQIPGPEPRASSSPGVVLAWCVLAFLAYLFLNIASTQFSFAGPTILNSLLFGWLTFLSNEFSKVDVNGETLLLMGLLLLAFVAIAAFSGVLRCLAGPSGAGQKANGQLLTSSRLTCRLLIALLVAFSAGTAFTAFAKNVIWVVKTDHLLTRSGRPTAARSRARNQLKRLGFAMHNFHEVHGSFPAGGTFDDSGRGLHSWTTRLLPYFEPHGLTEALSGIQREVPWDAAANQRAMQHQIPELLGPNMPVSTWVDERGFAATHFSANSWLMGPNSSLAIRDIKDGTTNTLMIGQIRDQIPAWGNPVNWRDPTRRLNSPGAFGSLHVGVVQFLLADGSVRAISENVDPQVMQAIASPDGGEQLGAF